MQLSQAAKYSVRMHPLQLTMQALPSPAPFSSPSWDRHSCRNTSSKVCSVKKHSGNYNNIGNYNNLTTKSQLSPLPFFLYKQPIARNASQYCNRSSSAGSVLTTTAS